MQSRLISIGL